MKTLTHCLAAATLVLGLSSPFAGAAAAADPAFDRALPVTASYASPTPVIAKSMEREQSGRRKWKKAWIASWVAFAAVSALDAHSSQGRREANPLLRNSDGRFSNGKASLLKGALGGGFFAFQLWTAKKNPEVNHYRAFTLTNTAVTAGLGAVAIRNYGLPSIQTAPAAATPLPDYLRPVE